MRGGYGRSRMISEDWVKEYEKILITRKIHRVSEIIGETEYFVSVSADPIEKRKKIMQCLGAIVSLINSIPIFEEHKKIVDGWYQDVNRIKSLLFGNGKALKKEGIKTVTVRKGIHLYTVPNAEGYAKILEKINNLFREIDKFTTVNGLRITLPMERKIGAKAILEEENIDLLDI